MITIDDLQQVESRKSKSPKLTLNQIAVLLGCSLETVNGLIRSGYFPDELNYKTVNDLAKTPILQANGLPVVRHAAAPDGKGKSPSSSLTDEAYTKEVSSDLRCVADRFLDAGYFVTTLGTYPIAFLRVEGLLRERSEGYRSMKFFTFQSSLICRTRVIGDMSKINWLSGASDEEITMAKVVMSSRIPSSSGGSVAYLG